MVSTGGERNPLSVALSATDEVFTYGNDDDSKRWPNSLTHHIVGGHYGYPYQFLTALRAACPADHAAARPAAPREAQGVLLQRGRPAGCVPWQPVLLRLGPRKAVDRVVVRKKGGTFAIARRARPVVTKGPVADFRPFSLAVAADGDGFWLVDWGYNGWLDARAQSGRLYRLRYKRPGRRSGRPRVLRAGTGRRALAAAGPSGGCRSPPGVAADAGLGLGPAAAPRTSSSRGCGPAVRRPAGSHAILGGSRRDRRTAEASSRGSIGKSLADPSARVRLQAARSAGIRRDRDAPASLAARLKDRDAAVRREAAIAIGKIGDPSVAAALYAALDDSDRFAAWSVRAAIRSIGSQALGQGRPWCPLLLDGRRTESLPWSLTDEAWVRPRGRGAERVPAAVRHRGSAADPDRRQSWRASIAGTRNGRVAGSAPTR